MKKIHFIFLVFYLVMAGCRMKTIPASAKTTPDTISVLTYNIHHANPPSKPGLIDVDAIAAVIRQQNVDVVALQEVDVFTGRSGKQLQQAEKIAALTDMKAFFAKAIDFDGGEYGVAILSKYPMENMQNNPLPTDNNTKGEHRTLATATIILPNDKRFVFACTHLDAQQHDTNRQLQIKKILQVLQMEKLPVILAGDINAVPQSDVVKQLDEYFTRTCVNNCGYTIPENIPDKTIDYIAFAPVNRFVVISHTVVDERYASDHRPVKAVLQLR